MRQRWAAFGESSWNWWRELHGAGKIWFGESLQVRVRFIVQVADPSDLQGDECMRNRVLGGEEICRPRGCLGVAVGDLILGVGR